MSGPGFARSGGVIALLASGVFGIHILDANPVGVLPVSDALLPAFSGLFGVPILFAALGGSGIPDQHGVELAIRPRDLARSAVAGAGAGGVVGSIPGVSSAIAAVLAFGSLPGESPDRGLIVAVSGVNTSNTIFALFALLALGSPRTGVLVAYERASLPLNLPLLLLSIVLAGTVAAVLVIVLGDVTLDVAPRIDNRRLVGCLLALLVTLAILFAGLFGVGVLALGTMIGFIPHLARSRRVHLRGVLVVPLATGM